MLLHHNGNRSWGDVNHIPENDTRLYVRCISHTYTESGNGETRLDRKNYFLHFVDSGSVLYDGKPFGEGEIYLMEPGTVHRLKCTSDIPLMQYCIEFQGSEAPILCADSGLSDTSRHRAAAPDRLRRTLREAVYDTDSLDEAALVKMSLGVLYMFLSQLLLPNHESSTHRHSGYAERAADFMRKKLYVRHQTAGCRQSGGDHGKISLAYLQKGIRYDPHRISLQAAY